VPVARWSNTALVVAASAGFLCAVLAFWTPGRLAFAGVQSPGGQYLAQIEQGREFPYLSVQVYLVIRRVSDAEVVTRTVLTARDTVSEAFSNIRKVEWNSDETVVVQQESPNFVGRRTFRVGMDEPIEVKSTQ